MGYMGFGMQSWVYKMRPRKPFSMERKKSFEPLPNYSREFKLQPSKNEDEKFKGFVAILFTIITILLLKIAIDEFKDYSNNHYKAIYTFNQEKNEYAFNFLMDSGISRLKQNNIQGAYSEFKLAKSIYPKDKKLNQLLIETTSILCENDIKYCNELDELMKTN